MEAFGPTQSHMSAAEYLKGPCQHCANSLEFPADGVGQTTTCPHCGQATVLQVDITTTDGRDCDARKSSGKLIAVALLLLAIGGGAIGVMVFRKPAENTVESERPPKIASSTEATPPSPEPPAPVKTLAAKSIDDLKAGPITLEKAKSGGLVYAVGTLRNQSDHQRFGVNIELALTDARGNKAGTAKDYRAVLEPRQEWRFRALILDSKATAATVSSIREE